MSITYTHQFAATMDALCACMKEAAEFLSRNKVSEEVSFAISLSLEEMVSNTIKYGYKDESGLHQVNVRIDIESDEVCLQIIDDGEPFNPLNLPPPDTSSPVEERPIGGLGIHLVKELLDTCEYKRFGNQNKIRVTKKFS